MPERAIHKATDGFTMRYMVKATDMRRVAEIQAAVFEHPSGADALSRYVMTRNCIGLVATHRGQIVGYVVFEYRRNGDVLIVELAVAPECQRRGFGRAMIHSAKCKVMGRKNYHRVVMDVDAGNIGGLQFMASMGFVSTQRDHDTVRFTWEKWNSRNRIARFFDGTAQ